MPEEVPLIQITVKDSGVTLLGSVPSAALKRAAEEAAVHTAGVVAVRDELTFPHPEQERKAEA